MNHVYAALGLGFGDEGKGSIVDYLVRAKNADLVVRYSGGSQAAHNVVLSNGQHHTFAQFGSGTLVPGVRTFLSRFMMVNPSFIRNEGAHLIQLGHTDIYKRLTVEREALVTTPWHVAANRLRELNRGKNAHGSCGMGIGETAEGVILGDSAALRVGDLSHGPTVRAKLNILRDRLIADLKIQIIPDDANPAVVKIRDMFLSNGLIEQYLFVYEQFFHTVSVVDRSWLAHQLKGPSSVVFEGAQGVLLDECYGFHPYTTWSNTTFDNAFELIAGSDVEMTRIGVLRPFMTRHGAGPLVTEGLFRAEWRSGEHNVWGEWQKGFRFGAIDFLKLCYALEVVGGVDELALTCMDRLEPGALVPLCDAYTFDVRPKRGYFTLVEDSVNGRERRSGRATQIRYLRSTSLDRQADLAALLGEAKPELSYVSNPAKLVGEIEGRLKTPVNIISYGPCFEDKVERSRMRDRVSVSR